MTSTLLRCLLFSSAVAQQSSETQLKRRPRRAQYCSISEQRTLNNQNIRAPKYQSNYTLKRSSSRSRNSKQMRSGRLLACSTTEQTTEEDGSALGGFCRLQPPRDGGGTVASRAEGCQSTTGRRERRARRWRRVGGAGEGRPRDSAYHIGTGRSVGQNSVCGVYMGRPT
jgi:hypothetical protein